MHTLYVIMGVSGCGKSTIGKLLANFLEIEFHDGDDFHPENNIKKMESGIPLEDEDRLPWLKRINNFARKKTKLESLVIACSALKHSYRNAIKKELDVTFIFLEGSIETIFERLKQRKSHFMPISLLQSQFDTLQKPKDALIISIEERNPDEILSEILSELKH